MMKRAIKRAQEKYNAKCTSVSLRFINESDAEIIEWLNSRPNKTDYIRRLIRKDIKEHE